MRCNGEVGVWSIWCNGEVGVRSISAFLLTPSLCHFVEREGLLNVNTSADLWCVGTFSALFH